MDVLKWVRAQWDRVAAWVLVAAGLVLLLIGWFGVSGTPYVAEQIPYLVSAGLVAVFLLGIGAVLWLSADLRDEWRKLDRIEQALRERGVAVPGPAAPAAGSDGQAGGAQGSNGDRPEGARDVAEHAGPTVHASVAAGGAASLPWRYTDLVVLYATSFAGAAVLLLAWWGASGTVDAAEHVTWLNVGVAGLLVTGTGNAVWLVTGRRTVGRRAAGLASLDGAGAPATTSAPSELVAPTLGTRYHRPGCPMAADRELDVATRDQHEEAGRHACGVCRP